MRVFVYTIILGLCSCSGVTRIDPKQAEVETPQAWQGEADSGEVQADWWRQLGSPQLSATIERCLQHNRDLRAAQARLAGAAAQAKLAGAELWPQLSAGLGASRQRSVFVGLPFGGGGPLANTYNNFGINLNASWEVDIWGRIASARDAAGADFAASAAEHQALRQSLAAQCAKAWFAALEAKEQLALARRSLESQQNTLAQVQRRFDAGLRPALELRRVRSQAASSRALLQAWQEALARSLRQLDLLQARYPDGKTALPGSLPNSDGPVPTGLPAALIRRRPDLVAAERRMAAAGFRVKSAEASLYPRLSLSGQLGTTSNETGDLSDLDFLIWNAASNLTAPLFQGGRLRQQVALEAAREAAAVHGFAQACLRAFTEVESLLAARRHLRRRVSELGAAATEARLAETMSLDRYRRGLSAYLPVLDAQRSALSVQGQLITARRQLLDLRVDLHLALGGGFAPTNDTSKSATGEPR